MRFIHFDCVLTSREIYLLITQRQSPCILAVNIKIYISAEHAEIPFCPTQKNKLSHWMYQKALKTFSKDLQFFNGHFFLFVIFRSLSVTDFLNLHIYGSDLFSAGFFTDSIEKTSGREDTCLI